MTLLERCSKGFSRSAWHHGEQLFRSDAVGIDQVGDTWLTAAVAGSQGWIYEVRLDCSEAGNGVLLADCTCPRCEEGQVCKHIIATIIAAERAGLNVPGENPLTVALEEQVVAADPVEEEYWLSDEANAGQEAKPSLKSVAEMLAQKLTPFMPVRHSATRPKAPASAWKRSLEELRAAQESAILSRYASPARSRKSATRQLCYGLDLERTQSAGLPYVGIRQRTLKKDGSAGKISRLRLARAEISSLDSADDRTLVGLLIGNEADWSNGYYGGYSEYGGYGQEYTGAFVNPAMIEVILPKLCASGRFGWIEPGATGVKEVIHPLAWDDGPAWQFRLNVALSTDQKKWQLRGELVRGEETASLAAPRLLVSVGIVIFNDRIARLDMNIEAFQWVALLRGKETLDVPVKQQDEFIEQLAVLPQVPRGNWPEELSWQDDRPTPRPLLRVAPPAKNSWRTDLGCRLEFAYGDWRVTQESAEMARFDGEARRVVHRDLVAEAAARDRLLAAGAKKNPYSYDHREPSLILDPKKLSAVVQQMAAAGWDVEAEGRLIRRPGEFHISITSGVDWFDLEATCDFDGVSASLPQLLQALRRGETIIELDDGSRGMLPADWLARYAPLAELGEAQGNHVRFVPTQAALLDALLAAQESQDYVVDEAFTRLRERLHSFQGVEPQQEPATFHGELRHYQREGLGWLHFLQDFSFGGCLADDMGLGKTVQVLALLEEQRLKQFALPNDRGLSPSVESAEQKGTVPLGPSDDAQENGTVSLAASNGSVTPRAPSLVVVPRSLVFNWIEEAKRFTPQLRVLNYTGLERRAVADQLHDYDLIVTTYGTLRRDIVQLREIQFDYAILDEAQAVKNASSQAAKAVRLLKARHRLAMTGTPVENHLGELWSLLEFLNPGMLGRSGKLTDLFIGRRAKADGAADRNEAVLLLARALRPFILRRTKQQVLTELPPKSEQTLYCELDGTERKQYDELREHYRQSLLTRISRDGVNKSKIHVLEALLRLRQAACHPGLIDKTKTGETSSKLETLLEQLAEVVDEGHKALVFSQFTSLLAIVRRQLDERKIIYEYLDGKTVKRQDRVERFQTDPDCPLFLISLKAGGQGLNLTAADYVFILDPWWNPAVEAQAVDRAHRIGQERHVFAYRLIARDTVEEKILQLQAHKRDLADAIISADNSLLRTLTAEDLQLLLS